VKINHDVMSEALARQGTMIRSREGRTFRFDGTSDCAAFLTGAEGLVHVAQDMDTRKTCRIKCFWTPDANRLKRSELLVQARLPDLGKTEADSLGGAPYELLHHIGPQTPFAIVMKNVHGASWKTLKESLRQRALAEGRYPPSNCPPLKVRATWAYGLATAVLNLEKRNFIHADLSDGNVMVTAHGVHAGDMALVDFDSFIHPMCPYLDSSCKGTDGYAATEIYRSQGVGMGSDRLAMALLIQEFLVMGDPSLTASEAFEWNYEQDEICSFNGEAYAAFSRKYPPLADLVVGALRATVPSRRPSPDEWRPLLKTLATGGALRPRGKKLSAVTLNSYPLERQNLKMIFPDAQRSLNLAHTPYGIHATLERNPDATIDAVVHYGSTIQVLAPGTRTWSTHETGERIAMAPGVVLFDSQGKMNVRIDGQEQ
jgi:serine/threonine protein kinase